VVLPYQGASTKNRHDNILFREWCCVAPDELEAPGEGCLLKFVPNGVDKVWASLLKEPLKVVYRCPC
jgi:hypothetical protein